MARRFSGDRLRTLRKAAGFSSMHALAVRTGIQAPQINRYELGQDAPQAANLVILAEALDITIDELFEELPEAAEATT